MRNYIKNITEFFNGIYYVFGAALAYYIGKDLGIELYHWIWS